jgi:hypothetical protein
MKTAKKNHAYRKLERIFAPHKTGRRIASEVNIAHIHPLPNVGWIICYLPKVRAYFIYLTLMRRTFRKFDKGFRWKRQEKDAEIRANGRMFFFIERVFEQLIATITTVSKKLAIASKSYCGVARWETQNKGTFKWGDCLMKCRRMS